MVDAGLRLSVATECGEEMPFEVVQSDARSRGGNPLYCYRPLTSEFISERRGLLAALPTHAPAVRALEGAGGNDDYLQACGVTQISKHPRELADAALHLFLGRVFEERNEFGFDDVRFSIAYEELERSLYDRRCVTEIIAPLLGLDLDPETDELALGDGLSIVRPHTVAAIPADMANVREPLLLVLRVAHERALLPSSSFVRLCFRRVLTALRLYEKGGYAIGPIGWSRVDDGRWSPVALGASGRPRLLTLIPAASEDELRGFCSLIGRRLPSVSDAYAPDTSGAGEVVWALARFEIGCERTSAFEALTDYLLGLRALLEPEGAASGRLAQRLAVICAPLEERAALAERIAQAMELEHKVITGLAPVDSDAETLVEEMAEHLRAILRDVLCGHLDADVRGVADELLSEAAIVAVAA